MNTNTRTKHERQAKTVTARQKFAAPTSYLDAEGDRDGRIKDLRVATPLAFAYGRLRFVNAHLALRHGGPCLTDDGVVYSDLMLPFAVEIAHLDRSSNFALALRRFRYWMPRYIAEIGESGLSEQWNGLAEMRSIAMAHNRTEAKAGNILWLPTAERIRTELRPTSAERDALNALYEDHPPARCVGVIDPLTEEEKREHNRLRMEATRRAAGVRPQSSRTQTADDQVLADAIGCSLRTIERRRKNQTLDAFLQERGLDVGKVCAQYIMENVPAQISDIEPEDPRPDLLAMFRDMLNDPHNAAPELVLPAA